MKNRRISDTNSDAGDRPDAVIDLGDWELRETGEHVGLGCVVMAPASLVGGRPPLDVISEELPFDVRVVAEWVMRLWGRARGCRERPGYSTSLAGEDFGCRGSGAR